MTNGAGTMTIDFCHTVVLCFKQLNVVAPFPLLGIHYVGVRTHVY